MKQIFTFILILFISSSKLIAQASTVVETLGTPSAMFINGNYMYIAESSVNRISQFDITDTNPTAVTISNACGLPAGLALNGNDLYIASFLNNKICKIDVTAVIPSLTLTDVVTGIGTVLALAFKGNDLYFTRSNGVISKIDITDATPTVIDVITLDPTDGIPRGLVFKGNDLYFSLYAGEILKIDISAPNPSSTLTSIVSGLEIPGGMAFKDDYLYIAEAFTGAVSRINITDAMPTATVVVTGLSSPREVKINGDDLYINSFNTKEILKFDITTLSIEDIAPVNALKIYPNPSNDYLQILGITKLEEFKIYSVLGIEVKHGFISKNEKINIRNLNSGIYFFKFNDTEVIRFIKE